MADVNKDGHMDFVATHNGDKRLSVVLGRGDGTFEPPNTIWCGSFPADVAIEDINADGINDLLVAMSSRKGLRVLLGLPDGSYMEPVAYSEASDSISITTGDFNEDGHLDVVVASYEQKNATPFYGNGDGTMKAGISFDVVSRYSTEWSRETPARHVMSRDLDGDGHLDLVISTTFREFAVYYGKGDGTFERHTPTSAGAANIHSTWRILMATCDPISPLVLSSGDS